MNKKENSSIGFYYVVIVMLLGIILLAGYCDKTIEEKNRTINNLQDEILMLKEENLDITNYNQQLVDEIEELRNE